jgi:uncharacterized protein (DUF1015 family)
MEIRPFKAYRFNPEIVGNGGDCLIPPYDLSGQAVREHFYRKNEHNIIRIICGQASEKDCNRKNQYTRAAEYLDDWIKKGAIKQDGADSIYTYIQNFDIGGKGYERASFISLAKLEDYGPKVMAHEDTLNNLKADFLKLQQATSAQFGLIFMLYEDATMAADKIIKQYTKSRPLLDHTDEDAVRHRLFAITAKNDVETITKMMADKSCIIADGHHRYATALSYYKQTKKQEAAYQIMAFTNTLSEGLAVLPTHRLVCRLKNFNSENLLAALKTNFDITDYSFDSDAGKAKAKESMLRKMKAESAKGNNAFGIYTGPPQAGCFHVVVLKDKTAMDRAAAKKSEAWRRLEVAVLHKLILEKLLGIGEKELAEKSHLEYVTDINDAVPQTIERVDTGQVQAAFFVNPEKIRSIQLVAQTGETMPQKSTFFYPKMFTGITIYKM